jgi:hypothetical protein
MCDQPEAQQVSCSGDLMKKSKISALFINDLDAGAGRFGSSTQYTVNNQMVNATLMNIADNPTNVQLPGVYKSEDCPRVPIICTGASFAPVASQCDTRLGQLYELGSMNQHDDSSVL